jgi:GAF domain
MDEQTPTPTKTSAATAHTLNMLDRELVSWFVGRGGSWTGTASELLSDLRKAANVPGETFPPSASLLCDHLLAHAASLRSLGVYVMVRQGSPRTVSLKRCPRETAAQENVETQWHNAPPPSSPEVAVRPLPAQEKAMPVQKTTESSAANLPQPAADLDSQREDRQTGSELASAMREITQIAKRVHGRFDHAESQNQIASDDQTKQTPRNEFTGMERTPDTEASGPVLEPPVAMEQVFEPVFDDAGEALFAILDLQKRTMLHHHPNTILSAFAKAAEQIAKASGVVICLFQNDSLLYQAVAGAVFETLQGDSGLLAGCVRSGAISQIQDAEGDPRVGPECSNLGIQSLILSPLTLTNGLSGAIAFCFKEKRSLHSADLFTLQMFSDAVSGAISENQKGISEISTKTDLERFLKGGTA